MQGMFNSAVMHQIHEYLEAALSTKSASPSRITKGFPKFPPSVISVLVTNTDKWGSEAFNRSFVLPCNTSWFWCIHLKSIVQSKFHPAVCWGRSGFQLIEQRLFAFVVLLTSRQMKRTRSLSSCQSHIRIESRGTMAQWEGWFTKYCQGQQW